MKLLLIPACLIAALPLRAQVKEARPDDPVGQGKILYERITQLQIRINEDNPAFQNLIPKERKDRFELLFTERKSLWQPQEDENPGDDMNMGDGGGMRVMIRMPGTNDISFHNLAEGVKVEQKELGDKNYIITDSIRKLTWKLTGETKSILGYNCMKATTQRTQESMKMNMDNGNMTREKVTDTLQIAAWFTADIPGSFGPEIYQGQLPGTILELDVNNGRTIFRALEISSKADISKIKEPAKGKKVTPEEFSKAREKLFQDMQQMGGPGGMRIIRSN